MQGVTGQEIVRIQLLLQGGLQGQRRHQQNSPLSIMLHA